MGSLWVVERSPGHLFHAHPIPVQGCLSVRSTARAFQLGRLPFSHLLLAVRSNARRVSRNQNPGFRGWWTHHGAGNGPLPASLWSADTHWSSSLAISGRELFRSPWGGAYARPRSRMSRRSRSVWRNLRHTILRRSGSPPHPTEVDAEDRTWCGFH